MPNTPDPEEQYTPEELAFLNSYISGGSGTPSQPGSQPAPVGIPSLPPRTKLDLSQPTVNVPNIQEFTIPAILSVEASTTAITHPDDLTQGDWLIIARNSRILHAYTMGKVSGDGEPPQATKAALDWMVPETREYLVPKELDANVESAVTYTAETASYVRAGVNKQEASVGFPFAAASFEREHEERQAGASYKKQLQCIGRWNSARYSEIKTVRCSVATFRDCRPKCPRKL